MATYHPTIKDLPIADIVVTDRLRPVNEDQVVALIELIEEYGFTTPVVVRKTRSGFELIDGAHRTVAMKRRGEERIPVVACTCTDDEAALMEAGQNLPGGMNALDDAVFLAAWRRAYLRKYPETAGGVAGALAKNGLQRTNLSFAEIVAERRGVSDRHIRRTIAAVEALDRAEIDALRGAGKVAVTDLSEIGKIGDPDERAQVILKLVGGNAKNAAAARRQWRAEQGLSTPVEDPVETALKALKTAWSRAPKEARRRFLRDHGAEVEALMYEGGL
ncbi:MAG: ParB N-terminal domain-containing protein [Paracoccaceae bacterium]